MSEPLSGDLKRLVNTRVDVQETVALVIDNFEANRDGRAAEMQLEKIKKSVVKFEDVRSNENAVEQQRDSQNAGHVSTAEEADDVRTVMSDAVDFPDTSSPGDMDNGGQASNRSFSTWKNDNPHGLQSELLFDGSPHQWPSFIELFNLWFHKNDKVPTLDKFYYLKSSLGGWTLDIVKTIPETAENYLLAYNTLVSKFDNETTIVQHHIASLLKTPNVIEPEYELARLHRHFMLHVRSLKDLGQPVEHWDVWLVALVCSKLDSVTFGEWQSGQSSKGLPLYSDMENFLAGKVAAYGGGQVTSDQALPIDELNSSVASSSSDEDMVVFIIPGEDMSMCLVCNENHQLGQCEDFLNMPVVRRKDIVFKCHLCFNCLQSNHKVRECESSSMCTKCTEKHHTSLHNDSQEHEMINSQNNIAVQTDLQSLDLINLPSMVIDTDTVNGNDTSSDVDAHFSIQVMLATVVFDVCDASGNMIPCRAILDSGSQLNFVTSECAHRLGLNIVDAPLTIIGIDQLNSMMHQCCSVQLCSRVSDMKCTLEMYLLPTVINNVPKKTFNTGNFNIPDYVQFQLADPSYNKTAVVDMVLGAGLFFEIMREERHVISNYLAFQDTVFGWVFTGQLITVRNEITDEEEPIEVRC